MTLQALQVVEAVNKVRRKGRYPVHNFLVEHKPWQIQPFMIAPVMAGETLKNINLQGRVISDPLKVGHGNIFPWWCEHYFFYVKARQLPIREAFEAMMLEGTDLSAHYSAADAATYHQGDAVNFTKLCLDFIVEEGGFRNDGEAADVATIDGLPAAAAIRHGENWADSLMADGTVDPANNLQNPHDGTVLAEYVEQYERMRAMRLIDMDFEDWLETYGVNIPSAKLTEKPELIRRTSNWAYPSNTIDPDTGTPTGAASWSISERADKDRFFHEPGWIVGVTVVRPKVYMGNQKGSAATMMDDAFTWLPRMLADQPHVSVKEFVGGSESPTGPLRNQTNGYWVDLRDLFLYGDQFIRVAAESGYQPALPTAAGEKRFPTLAMANALFQDAGGGIVRQEGVARFAILGHPTTATDMT